VPCIALGQNLDGHPAAVAGAQQGMDARQCVVEAHVHDAAADRHNDAGLSDCGTSVHAHGSWFNRWHTGDVCRRKQRDRYPTRPPNPNGERRTTLGRVNSLRSASDHVCTTAPALGRSAMHLLRGRRRISACDDTPLRRLMAGNDALEVRQAKCPSCQSWHDGHFSVGIRGRDQVRVN
jgi:hypothetical protein